MKWPNSTRGPFPFAFIQAITLETRKQSQLNLQKSNEASFDKMFIGGHGFSDPALLDQCPRTSHERYTRWSISLFEIDPIDSACWASFERSSTEPEGVPSESSNIQPCAREQFR